MDEDSQSWQDRCDRYFTSISESGEHKQNGYVKNKDTPNVDVDRNAKSDEYPEVWKDLANVRKRRREHPVISYIRNAVFKIDIHGTRLAGKSGHRIELLIWCIVVLAVFSFTMFLLVLQYSEYAEKNTFFKIQSVSNGEIITPSLSVSVCNQNVLRRSAIRGGHFEYLINDSVPFINNSHLLSGQSVKSVLVSNTKLSQLLTGITDDVSEIQFTTLLEKDVVIREMFKVSNESIISRLRNTGSTDWFQSVVTLNKSDVKLNGYQRDDVIVSCFIGSRECKESEFSLVPDVKFGNCFTLTPEVTSESVQLILNAHADEYIDGAAPSVGFKVIVHGTGSDIIDGQPISVGVNSLTSLHVKKETVTNRLEDTCSQGPGTKKQCLRACHATHVKTYCGCSITDHESLPLCRNDVIEHLICRKAISLLQVQGHLGCACKENCRDISYDLTQSAVLWPSSAYMSTLSSVITRKQGPLTDTQIRENIAAVHLNLQMETRVVQDETKQFQILELLARFGGLLAFVAGVSMLTMVEIVWSIMKSFFDGCLYFKKSSGRGEDVERLSDSAITSVTWAMYKQKRRQEELNKEFQMNNVRTDRHAGQTSGLGGNVHSRLYRRNSHLEPISENGDARPGNGENYSGLQRAPSDNKYNQSRGSNQSFELKQSKYRVPSTGSDSDMLYSNTNGHVPKIYPETNGNVHNGVSLISGPYSNNVYHNYNRRRSNDHAERQYTNRPPMTSHMDNRGRYETGNDRVQLHGNTSAYFHSNSVSEPTFL